MAWGVPPPMGPPIGAHSSVHAHPPAAACIPALTNIALHRPITLILIPTLLQVCRLEPCEALPGPGAPLRTALQGEEKGEALAERAASRAAR